MTKLQYRQIGSDPELVLLDHNGVPQNASAIIPFSKATTNTSYASDGVSLELHPRHNACRVIFMRSLFGLLQQLETKFGTEAVRTGSAYKFSPEEIQKGDDRSRRWLCNPSMNAYGLEARTPTKKFTHRFAGGHMTMSMSGNPTDDQVVNLIKWADVVITCVQIMLDPFDKVASILRRKYYGLPGEYRVRDMEIPASIVAEYGGNVAAASRAYGSTYGGKIVEYRTPSNNMVADPLLWHYFFGAYRHCLALANVPLPVKDSAIVEAIMEYDATKARAIWDAAVPVIRDTKLTIGYTSPLYNKWIGNIQALLDNPKLLNLPELFKSRKINMMGWKDWNKHCGGFEHYFAREILQKKDVGYGEDERIPEAVLRSANYHRDTMREENEEEQCTQCDCEIDDCECCTTCGGWEGNDTCTCTYCEDCRAPFADGSEMHTISIGNYPFDNETMVVCPECNASHEATLNG